jgi:hypothetical protein
LAFTKPNISIPISTTYEANEKSRAMRLGNGKWEHTAFNNRLQPKEIGLGTTSSDASLQCRFILRKRTAILAHSPQPAADRLYRIRRADHLKSWSGRLRESRQGYSIRT